MDTVQGMEHVTLSVPDISCGHCKSTIEGALNKVDGINRAEVAIEAKTVTVSFDDAATDVEAIRAAIEEEGYDVAG
ncbi:MAG: copper ion binding protein [Acidimicrobiia bacterium]